LHALFQGDQRRGGARRRCLPLFSFYGGVVLGEQLRGSLASGDERLRRRRGLVLHERLLLLWRCLHRDDDLRGLSLLRRDVVSSLLLQPLLYGGGESAGGGGLDLGPRSLLLLLLLLLLCGGGGGGGGGGLRGLLCGGGGGGGGAGDHENRRPVRALLFYV
jgi:hypothetical protein